MGITIRSSAQYMTDTVTIHRLNNTLSLSDTTTLVFGDDQKIKEQSHETRIILWYIMQHGELNLHEKYPYLRPFNQYGIVRQPEILDKYNIDRLKESLNNSVEEYYKEYYKASMTGTILSYLSFFLIFL
jgi:hypothetical protein